MRLLIIILLAISFILACGTLPPDKKFSTTVYLPVNSDGTELSYPCLKYNKTIGESVVVCPDDPQYPKNPITIDYGNLEDNSVGGLINELDYQSLLIKSCKEWR